MASSSEFPDTCPSSHDVMLAVLGGVKCDGEEEGGEGFSFSKNTWSSLCEMPGGFNCGGAVVARDKVYVMGGTQKKEVTNTMCMYDPSEDTWTSFIPTMRSERAFLGVAMLNDRIYAIGGTDDMDKKEGLRTAEVLDLTMGETQEWRNIASMNTGRASVGVAVLNGKIYAVGGCTEAQQHLSSVECYDPELDVWSPVADLSVPRAGPGVCVLDGVLYCVGGSHKFGSYSNTVEKYNEDSNTWSLVVEMNHRRACPGVIAYAGRLYVVGGYDGDIIHSSVEMFNPITNTWTLVTDMSTGRIYPTVGVISKPRTFKSED